MWTQSTSVTDRQTDRRTDRITITKTVQRRASHGNNNNARCLSGSKKVNHFSNQPLRIFWRRIFLLGSYEQLVPNAYGLKCSTVSLFPTVFCWTDIASLEFRLIIRRLCRATRIYTAIVKYHRPLLCRITDCCCLLSPIHTADADATKLFCRVGGVYTNSQLAHDDCRRIRQCEQHSVFWRSR